MSINAAQSASVHHMLYVFLCNMRPSRLSLKTDIKSQVFYVLIVINLFDSFQSCQQLQEMLSCLFSQPPSRFSFFFFFLPLTLCSMGLFWMLDLHTRLCIYTSGMRTSRMAQAWSPSTPNVTLRVSISTFSAQKRVRMC